MKIGIALDNFGPGQLAFEVVAQANMVVATKPDINIVGFYETLSMPMVNPHFATMPIAEAFGFDGPIVATNLSTASKLIKFPSCPRKLFLVWDLEWLRQPRAFSDFQSVYGHPSLSLLARGNSHAQIISQCWNRDVAVMDGFKFGSIIEAAKT